MTDAPRGLAVRPKASCGSLHRRSSSNPEQMQTTDKSFLGPTVHKGCDYMLDFRAIYLHHSTCLIRVQCKLPPGVGISSKRSSSCNLAIVKSSWARPPCTTNTCVNKHQNSVLLTAVGSWHAVDTLRYRTTAGRARRFYAVDEAAYLFSDQVSQWKSRETFGKKIEYFKIIFVYALFFETVASVDVPKLLHCVQLPTLVKRPNSLSFPDSPSNNCSLQAYIEFASWMYQIYLASWLPRLRWKCSGYSSLNARRTRIHSHDHCPLSTKSPLNKYGFRGEGTPVSMKEQKGTTVTYIRFGKVCTGLIVWLGLIVYQRPHGSFPIV